MKSVKRLTLSICSAALAAGLALTACGGTRNQNTAQPPDASATSTAAETSSSTAAAATPAATSAAVTAAAAGDNSWADIEAANVLKLGLDDSLPPMGFRNEKNEIVGFDIDLAKAVTERLNIQLELVPIDWNMKQNELDAKNIDCIWNGYSYSDERAKVNELTDAYLKNEQVVVTMKNSGIATLADMAGKRLALQETSTAEDALEAAVDFKTTLAEVVPFKDNVTAFTDVEAGQTDAILLDSTVANYYISQQVDPGAYVVIPEPLAVEDYMIGFRKGDVALRDKIQNTLKEMGADGTAAQISQKWFGRDIFTLK